MTLFTDRFYTVAREVWDVESIIYNNEELERAYTGAALKLKIIARDKGIESEEYRSAREKHKQDLSKFVRIGSAA